MTTQETTASHGYIEDRLFDELRERLTAVIDDIANRSLIESKMDGYVKASGVRERVCLDAVSIVARAAYAADGGAPSKAAQLLRFAEIIAIVQDVEAEDIDART